MNHSIAILAGGGPAPGINTVIATLAKVFLSNGFRVIGIHNGYKGLVDPQRETIEFDFALADSLFTVGGSFLGMSRYKPKDEEFDVDFFAQNNIKLLVTIGGDDTASTANRLATFLQKKELNVSNIHVPKTIDNDLPLPGNMPTFGFQTAKDEGVHIASTVYEDARTSRNWFVMACMGREAGHLALGIGEACHLPMIIIPEMFLGKRITGDKIARMIISSIIKRKIMGIEYGAAMVSEGVFHFMTDEDIKASGANFTYDAHGHPELFNVSKAHVFNLMVRNTLSKTKLSTRLRPVEMGFELRCARPGSFDLSLCTHLALGVYQLFTTGKTGCIVAMDENNSIVPLYLHNLTGSDGKVKPRLVNMSSPLVQNIFAHNLHYLTKTDYTLAKKHTEYPELFDFQNILNED